VIGAGHRQLEDAAVVGVVHQRVEAGFAIAGTHGDQRHFAGERHEAFQQAGTLPSSAKVPTTSSGLRRTFWPLPS
jgi:hypothetical protein